MIFKQYYMYNYTPLYLKVVRNWLVCCEILKSIIIIIIIFFKLSFHQYIN